MAGRRRPHQQPHHTAGPGRQLPPPEYRGRNPSRPPHHGSHSCTPQRLINRPDFVGIAGRPDDEEPWRHLPVMPGLRRMLGCLSRPPLRNFRRACRRGEGRGRRGRSRGGSRRRLQPRHDCRGIESAPTINHHESPSRWQVSIGLQPDADSQRERSRPCRCLHPSFSWGLKPFHEAAQPQPAMRQKLVKRGQPTAHRQSLRTVRSRVCLHAAKPLERLQPRG